MAKFIDQIGDRALAKFSCCWNVGDRNPLIEDHRQAINLLVKTWGRQNVRPIHI